MRIRSPKDFWAGLMFLGIGLAFAVGARHYDLGSAARMAPGYFPTLLGGGMAVVGGIVLGRSLVIRGEKVPAVSFRIVFFITLSLVLFGFLLKPLGLVLALALLVLISAFAGHEFRLGEVGVLSAVLIVLSVVVFVKGLGLPFPLWPRFLE
jgi:hypothetical protein